RKICKHMTCKAARHSLCGIAFIIPETGEKCKAEIVLFTKSIFLIDFGTSGIMKMRVCQKRYGGLFPAPTYLFQGTSKYPNPSDVVQICDRFTCEKTQEYLVYFKFFASEDGVKMRRR
ncbi:MAG: hypothetical protein ACI4XB_04900, partial [Ruminococcus sp.]